MKTLQISLLLILVSISASATSFAQERMGGPFLISAERKKLAEREWRWSKVKWDNDQAYEKVDISFGERMKAGVMPSTIARKSDFPNLLNDSLKQYEWALASYEDAKRLSFPPGSLRPIEVRLSYIAQLNTPHSQRFSRLYFLVQVRQFPNEKLADVAKRLLKAFPRDFEIKWFAVKVINPGMRPQDRQLCIRLAKELQKLAPNKPESGFLLAGVYERIWYSTWMREDCQMAIEQYRASIRTSKSDNPRRKSAEDRIKWMQTMQPILEKNIKNRPRYKG